MSDLNFEGAIFDCDGVLMDSMSIWNDLGVRYVREQGFEPEEGLRETLFSMSMEQGVEYVSEHYPNGKTPEEVMGELLNIIHDFYFYEVLAKTGAKEIVALLKSRNIPMVVLTSSPRSHVEAALKRAGILDVFEKVLTTTEIGMSKHNRDVFDVAAKELGLGCSDIVVFEDSFYALATAADAGYKTVGVFDADGESNQEGLRQKADLYVKDLMEAYEAFK
ncbi:MAG: HAD family phosphatase [Clostridia bacterium]|nr:HAD family phosphatase [Clostridia bacterium]